MLLFSRTTISTQGRELEAIPAAIEVAGIAAAVTGTGVNVFRYLFGEPSGTVMWSSIVESQAALLAIDAQLMGDTGYLDQVQSMQGLYSRPVEDHLSQVLSPLTEAPEAKYYGITRAAMANGKFAGAIEHGLRAAEYMGTSLGIPSVFVKSTYGGFGDVAWIVGFDTIEGADKFDAWQMSDTGYHDIVAEAGGLYVENSGTTSLIEKLN